MLFFWKVRKPSMLTVPKSYKLLHTVLKIWKTIISVIKDIIVGPKYVYSFINLMVFLIFWHGKILTVFHGFWAIPELFEYRNTKKLILFPALNGVFLSLLFPFCLIVSQYFISVSIGNSTVTHFPYLIVVELGHRLRMFYMMSLVIIFDKRKVFLCIDIANIS